MAQRKRYGIRQRALTTGTQLSPEQLADLYELDVSDKIQRQALTQAAEEEKGRYAEKMALTKEEIAAQERAAKISGVATAVGTTAQAALTYKLLSSGTPTTQNIILADGTKATVSNGVVTTSSGEIVGSEALAGAKVAPATTPWYSQPIPGTSGMGAKGAGITPKGAGTAALAGYAGGRVGQSKEVQSALVGGKKERQYTGAIVGGAAAGAAVGGLPGAVIGGAVGAIDVAAQDTIICTELHRQGLLSDTALKFEQRYGKIVGDKVHKGYLILARPIVEEMQKSKLFTKFIAFFVIAFAREVAHTFKPKEYKGSILGKVIIKLGIPLCKLAYRYKVRGK